MIAKRSSGFKPTPTNFPLPPPPGSPSFLPPPFSNSRPLSHTSLAPLPAPLRATLSYLLADRLDLDEAGPLDGGRAAATPPTFTGLGLGLLLLLTKGAGGSTRTGDGGAPRFLVGDDVLPRFLPSSARAAAAAAAAFAPLIDEEPPLADRGCELPPLADWGC